MFLQNAVSLISAIAAVGAVFYARRAIRATNRLAVLFGAAQTCQEYQGRVLDLCEKGYTVGEIRRLFDLQDSYNIRVMENDCGRVEDVVQIHRESQARRSSLPESPSHTLGDASDTTSPDP